MIDNEQLKKILTGALFAAGEPLTIERMLALFTEEEGVTVKDLREALAVIQNECEPLSYHLKEVASGFRFQVNADLSQWLVKLWEEKPARYSRAVLETLVLIAYRQPVTRGEVEEIRGVTSSSHIFKTLNDREWIKVVGHKDVPGRPSLYATTKQFLDYFNLKSLEDLPTLGEIVDLDLQATKLDQLSLPIEENIESFIENERSSDIGEEAPHLELEKILNESELQLLSEEALCYEES